MEDTAYLIDEFELSLLQVNRVKAAEIFERCFTSSGSIGLLEQLAIESLEIIGAGWENGTISLSQVYMSGIICEELIDQYFPRSEVSRKKGPKMAIAVLQDYHALGKRIVYSVIRAGGYDLIDFGQGLSVDDLVEKTIENQIEILLISTLMLPSALKVKEVRKNLTERGYTVRIIVGGAPFRLDSKLWLAVGADEDGRNASYITRLLETEFKGVIATDELI